MFGSPETTPGGRALKFFSSVRLDIRKITGIKEGETTIGSRVKAKVVKNKMAPPFRQAEFDLMHDCGISKEGDLIDLALEDKIMEKSGGHHSYGEMRLGNGRENVKQFLRDNPALFEEISKKILEARGLAGNKANVAEENGEAQEEPAKPETPTRGRRAAAAASES
jgi:recombination protein RecA